jgi:hypothetical protein
VHPLKWTLEKPLVIPIKFKGCIFMTTKINDLDLGDILDIQRSFPIPTNLKNLKKTSILIVVRRNKQA